MLIDIHGHCLKNKDLPYRRGDEPFVWPELLLNMHKEIGIDRGVLLPACCCLSSGRKTRP